MFCWILCERQLWRLAGQGGEVQESLGCVTLPVCGCSRARRGVGLKKALVAPKPVLLEAGLSGGVGCWPGVGLQHVGNARV